MGRLIDADALIDKLKRTSAFGCVRNAADKNVFEIIEEQPTAYDVEKVVAGLIQFGLNSMDKQIYDSDTYYDGVSVAIRKACNIVKRGGADG